jgi:hypothetical protein
MADEDEKITRLSDVERDKREQRAMWIFSAVIVLLIVGGMGANMLFHHDKGAGTDISSQSRTAPQQ